ncbi:XdhC family protein [Hyphococcus lacteus]|uniref:XdhC family protein n=1 Tax=Hyphococcus lacteus TaxID=3143536 RepID=A0ABV3ZAT5_9PROT
MQSVKQRCDIGEHALEQFRFMDQCHQEKLRTALVTIVGVIGRASRQVGAHMIVCENGSYAGSVSSGCIDGNVVAMALDVIRTGTAKRVQFGEGSPFVDVKLPCGGGVDLLILPTPDKNVISAFVNRLSARKVVEIALDPSGIEIVEGGRCEGVFHFTYVPKIEIRVAGRGLELLQFSRAASAAGFDIISYTPDIDDKAECESFGKSIHLSAVGDVDGLSGDEWTAIVLLFHEHEWEPPLLKQALKTDAFYIGALGSRVTHDARLEALRQNGVSEHLLKRLRGPIGLVPSMRNASMLAVSTLAEIIEAFQQSQAIK